MNANRKVSIAVGSKIRASLTKTRTTTGVLIGIVVLLPGICPADTLLSGPQKIVIDTAHNRLLVSNYNTGDLIQIDEEGNQSYFVRAADFIDGMHIVGNTVYGAARNKTIKAYDLDTGELTMSLTVTGTGYLSSLIADDAGYLYISCPLGHEIYKMRVSDQTYWTFVGGGALNKPNGMIFQAAENRLVVIEDRPSPRVLAVTIADSAVTTLAATALAGGDGIEQDTAGNYYVAGYYLPGVYRLDPGFSEPPEMIFQGSGIVYPTYDASDNSLLVTCYTTDTWERIPLAPTGASSAGESKACLRVGTFPNPGSHGTTIRFELTERAHSRVDVYGVSGDLVRTLRDELQGPGTCAVPWDGTDGTGRRVACGTYFLRLKVNDMTQTQPAVLTR